MIPSWLVWVAIAAMAAWMLYARFAGKSSSAEAHAVVAGGGRLVDVRSPGEFASGHLDGAINIPVDQLASRSGEIGPADTPVVVYCRSGARSASAAGVLRRNGFTRVLDLGPMTRW
jgi:phage shock protein E